MVKLSPRQQKIISYLQANGTLHKGRYAVKIKVAYKYAQFFELSVLQQIGTITYSPEQKCYYVNAATGGANRDEMFSGERFGGTKPIRAEEECTARTQYMDARHNADELRVEARDKAFITAPNGFQEFQSTVNRFYEAIEIEARCARELFDLLSDQIYD